MDYAQQQRNPTRHAIGLLVVILAHVLVIYALVTGLARKAVQVIKKPLETSIIEELKLPPPPPPPPKKIEIPKPPPPETYVPPPDIPVMTAPAGIEKGHVVARLNIDENGNVTDVIIVTAEPPRHFDREVISALKTWKFRAEGEKYVGEVEINFSLKD